jgi:hypothetical protein
MKNNNTLWTSISLLFLGIWLIVTSLSFTYQSEVMKWNDLLSGILLIVFGSFTFFPQRLWAAWCVSLVGIWLQFAPLVFWAPDAFSYLNDTMIGVAVISLALLIPGVQKENAHIGESIPEGWSYNPSSWSQRLPIITLGFICWMAARYMAAYQLGYLNKIWDPFFYGGPSDVITSNIFTLFPISDAGLGAFAYTLETLLGCKGSSNRWLTRPWIVLLFGFFVVPVGLVSLLLIISQTLFVGYWCTWCLLIAFCMLWMIALTVDEVVASLLYLWKIKKESPEKFWKVFWKGGDLLEHTHDDTICFKQMFQGISLPLKLLLSFLIGLGFILIPYLFKTDPSMAYTDFICGTLVIVVTIISFAEVTRIVRYVNILLSFVIFVVAILVGDWPSSFASIALMYLSFPRGTIEHSYGVWNKNIL